MVLIQNSHREGRVVRGLLNVCGNFHTQKVKVSPVLWYQDTEVTLRIRGDFLEK